MPAPKGNKYWKLRSKHGRDKIFSDPEILWEVACEYFEWAYNHPWSKHEPVKAGDHFGETVTSPTERPLSIQALCIYLDIDENTFTRYCSEDEYKDFWAIANKIKAIIEVNQFEGATVGAYNSNIVIRKLGLKERVENSGGINISGFNYIKPNGSNNKSDDKTG